MSPADYQGIMETPFITLDASVQHFKKGFKIIFQGTSKQRNMFFDKEKETNFLFYSIKRKGVSIYLKATLYIYIQQVIFGNLQ